MRRRGCHCIQGRAVAACTGRGGQPMFMAFIAICITASAFNFSPSFVQSLYRERRATFTAFAFIVVSYSASVALNTSSVGRSGVE